MDKLKKTRFYWSDRWLRVIVAYKCSICGKDEVNLNKKKPQLEKEHICINVTDKSESPTP